MCTFHLHCPTIEDQVSILFQYENHSQSREGVAWTADREASYPARGREGKLPVCEYYYLSQGVWVEALLGSGVSSSCNVYETTTTYCIGMERNVYLCTIPPPPPPPPTHPPPGGG